MQKLVYLSNSRDYTEQGNINENKYFTHINGLLNQGWKFTHVTDNVVDIDSNRNPSQKETFVAFVLPEKLKMVNKFLYYLLTRQQPCLFINQVTHIVNGSRLL